MKQKKITLEDGRTVNIVSLDSGDVDRLYNMFSSMSEEALRWSMAPYKRERVKTWLHTPTLMQLAAEHDDEVVGFVCIETFTHPRRKGNGYLGTYLHQEFRGTGLGSIMTGLILKVAEEQGVHKVNQELVADDEYWVRVLQEHGFDVEGTRRDAFHGGDGRYHDTLMMGKILDDET